MGWLPASLSPSVWAMVGTTRAGSTSRERRTNQTPSANASTSSAATCSARRVLPMPPGPVSVTSRTSSRPQQRRERGQLLLATQQRGGLQRQVVLVGVERLERREVGGQAGRTSWKSGSGCWRSLRRCAPRSRSVTPAGRRCSTSARVVCGEQHLAAVTGGGDAGGAMDVEPDVVVAHELRRPGMQPHAHPQGGALAARHAPASARVASAAAATAWGAVAKATKKASPWVSTSTPLVRGEGRAQQRLMLAQGTGVLVAQPLEQLGAALDVGEQEGDGAGGEWCHGDLSLGGGAAEGVVTRPLLRRCAVYHAKLSRAWGRPRPVGEPPSDPRGAGACGRMHVFSGFRCERQSDEKAGLTRN